MIHAINKFFNTIALLVMFFLMSSISLPTKTIQQKILRTITVVEVRNEDIPTFSPLPASRVGSGFGFRNRPIKGFHPGVDMGAKLGTAIRPAANGLVIRVQKKWTGYGHNVIIKHNKAYKTLYAHMSKVLVKVGDYVEVSDTIGLVGSTGLSTCPHLHFEVIENNRKIDPESIVRFDSIP